MSALDKLMNRTNARSGFMNLAIDPAMLSMGMEALGGLAGSGEKKAGAEAGKEAEKGMDYGAIGDSIGGVFDAAGKLFPGETEEEKAARVKW